MMIEVFKTNVTETCNARMLTEQIEFHFEGCTASFDLEDCDHILRVQSNEGLIYPFLVISLVEKLGYQAEVLKDEMLSISEQIFHKSGYQPVKA